MPRPGARDADGIENLRHDTGMGTRERILATFVAARPRERISMNESLMTMSHHYA